MPKISSQKEKSTVRQLVAMAFERRGVDRRQPTGAEAVSTPPLLERRKNDRRRLVNMALFCLPSLFATTTDAGERVQFEASHAYTSDSVTLRAEISKPDGEGPFPAIVLMHGCGGWQPAVRYTMNAYADYFVRHGFAVLDLDSFGPRNSGGGKVCESTKKLSDALKYRTSDAYDAMKYLKSQKFIDGNNIFLMGQSNGGSVAINVAKGDTQQGKKGEGEGFRAVVAYYPWCGSFGNRKVDLASPLLVFGGGQDDWVPARECEGVQSTGAQLQVKVYPEAAHSFDLEIMPQRYLGKLIGNNKHAAEDSRERMLAFFIEHTIGDALKATYLAKNGGTIQKPPM